MTYRIKALIGERVPDWQIKFSDFIVENMNKPFTRGAFDCSQFCIQAEQVIMGKTRWTDFIGGYSDLKGAMRRIKEAQASSLWDLVDQRMTRKPVNLAKRGDFIGHLIDEGESLGVMDANGFWATGDNGLLLLHRSNALVCWDLDNG